MQERAANARPASVPLPMNSLECSRTSIRRFANSASTLIRSTGKRSRLKAGAEKLDSEQANRTGIAAKVEQLRTEKSKADGQVIERTTACRDLERRNAEVAGLRDEIGKLPAGFDETRFRELQELREELRPKNETAISLKSALQRLPAVRKEAEDAQSALEVKNKEIAAAEKALLEMAFSPEAHEKLTREFETASVDLSNALVQVATQRGEVNTAAAILEGITKEEDTLESKLEDLKKMQFERIHLQTLADALDKLRAQLNDRIRPELEAIASELLAMMTDGRYSVLEINENYEAMIRDDGELKSVISGGEEDIVNLALRLAISQMIADRAGQSFSLLVLDEVFGSLDDTRRTMSWRCFKTSRTGSNR